MVAEMKKSTNYTYKELQSFDNHPKRNETAKSEMNGIVQKQRRNAYTRKSGN